MWQTLLFWQGNKNVPVGKHIGSCGYKLLSFDIKKIQRKPTENKVMVCLILEQQGLEEFQKNTEFQLQKTITHIT